MRSAYDDLDIEIKSKINDLICEHTLIFSREKLGFNMEKELNKQMLNNFMPIEQPLVRNIENT